MAGQKIQLYDLVKDVQLYEPHLLRVPMRIEDLKPEQLTHAAAKTAKDILRRSGAPDIEVTDEDAAIAETMFMSQVMGDGSAVTPAKMQKPETVLKLEALVQEYDWRVIQHADQIRMLVTNKLLGLSDHKDPKVQLKAVELLGKLADVGMFVEKQEITYKQKSDTEIEAALREKLGLLIEGEFTTVEKAAPPPPAKEPEPEISVNETMPLPELPKIDMGSLLNE
jgi:hypothetical protein